MCGGTDANGNSIGAGGGDRNNNRYERGTWGDSAAEAAAAETRNHHPVYGSPRKDLEHVNDYDQLYDERARQQVMKISVCLCVYARENMLLPLMIILLVKLWI